MRLRLHVPARVSGISASNASSRLRRALLWFGIYAAVVVASFVLLVVASAPAVFAVAVACGLAAQGSVQGMRIWFLLRGRIPAGLATFSFSQQKIEVRSEDAVLAAWLRNWRWRLVSASIAGCACVLALRTPVLKIDMLPHAVFRLNWLARGVMAAQPALPLLAAALLLFVPTPWSVWSRLAMLAVRARAASATARVLPLAELRGLEAGSDALWRAIGVERQSEYQAAFERHLSLRPHEVVVSPESALAVQSVLVTLARQDLNHLSEALAICHDVDLSLAAARTLADAGRNPAQEMRAAELAAETQTLRMLAAQRRWSELRRHADELQERFRQCCNDLRARMSASPPVVLAAGSDPYRVLGIDADTPTPLVRKLRMRLAQLYHPDISDGPGNSTKMAELNAAFDAVMRERDKKPA
ncbi:hypothetical protein [Silvibacterium sp.]|uniref:hypothetical protein n=1 Tax=Silvibacterium sp. TaxID=1964179 RepID=UPI0039E30021